MPMVSCPNCLKKLKVADGMESKRFRCPGCGEVVSGPNASGSLPKVEKPAKAETSPTKAPVRGPVTGERKPAATGGSATDIDTKQLLSFLRPAAGEGELGRLGPYKILKILGHGGMGVVYKAEDIKLKRSVALKVMLPDMGKDKTAVQRFLREAQAVAAIAHQHVVRVYQVDEDHGVPYMAMEFLTGEALEDRLMREPILPVADALRIGREVAEALEATHACGLIHRDIKPSNIWLDGDAASVKVLDFGLVRPEGDSAQLTRTGVVLGTPQYMSLEQARGAKVDARTDLFSLGVLLYRMTTGQVPFKGKNAIALITAMAKEEPQSPQIFNFDLSSEMCDLIIKLLAKSPDDRVQTAGEVVKILRAIESGETSSPPTPEEKSAAKPAKSRPGWLLPAIVCGSLVVIGVVGLLIWKFVLS